MKRCDVERLSAFSDGELAADDAARVQAHVDGCADCRRALDELGALKAALAAEAAHAPEPRRGWAELSEKLNSDSPRRIRIQWRWMLAPAALALAFGAAAWRHHRAQAVSDDQLIAEAESAFRAADVQYQQAIEKLAVVAERARGGWSGERQRAFDDAAHALDAATEKCRAVARARPADVDAEELLFAAYQKQIQFLQDQLWRGAQ
jgi:anti-sigma factor RsiW